MGHAPPEVSTRGKGRHLEGLVQWLLEDVPLPVLGGMLAGGLVMIIVTVTRAATTSIRIRHHPFEPRRRVFSPTEIRFLRALEDALGGRVRVMGKMRIADLLRVSDGLDTRAHRKAFERIARRHVDFVLLDAETFSLLAVIELEFGADDSASAAPQTLVDQIFAAARIPMLRVPMRSRYEPLALARQVQALLGQDKPI